MLVEYIRYTVPHDRAEEFEDAYRRASRVLAAEAHCLGHEVARGVEEPEHFVVRAANGTGASSGTLSMGTSRASGRVPGSASSSRQCSRSSARSRR